MIISMFIVMMCLYAFLIVNIFSASVMKVHMRSKEDITKHQGNSTNSSVIKAKRGTIYDSKQTVIAEDITSYNLLAYLNENRKAPDGTPHYVVDVDATAKFLAETLGGEADYYLEQMDNANGERYQTEFGVRGKGLDLKTKTIIEESKLPGLEFTITSKRHYPLGQFSSQLIGFSDLDQEAGHQVGKMGIESMYNDKLTGVDGHEITTVTSNGYTLPNTTKNIQYAEDGDDIYLTLNKNVQLQLEDSLAKSMTLSNTDKAWGMVMEIDTGKVIAMAQAPSFDPEVREDVEYLFYPTSFAYEPGSTMKAITYAAAIEEGFDTDQAFDSRTLHLKYDATGNPYRVNAGDNYDDIIANAGLKDWGTISFKTGFAVSSNVGIVDILTKHLGYNKFEEYLDKFKFFEPANLDLIDGVAGHKLYRYPIEKINNGFGQGSTVTMLQMAQAYAAIINDGVMMKPYVVDQIIDHQNEVVYKGKPEEIANPISKETSAQMRELMAMVIDDDLGTGRNYRLDEINQIAKTGTAQLVIDGKYSTSRYISSIATAFPAEAPKYLVFYAYESQLIDANWLLTAEPVQELVLKTAEEFNLIESSEQKDKPETQDDIIVSEMPHLVNHSKDYALRKLQSTHTDVIFIGEGNNIIKQYPSASDKIISNQKVILYTGEGQITMPDMKGWSRKEVVAFWNASGASFILEGHGNVYNQSVPTGTIIDPDTEIKVSLR